MMSMINAQSFNVSSISKHLDNLLDCNIGTSTLPAFPSRASQSLNVSSLSKHLDNLLDCNIDDCCRSTLPALPSSACERSSHHLPSIQLCDAVKLCDEHLLHIGDAIKRRHYAELISMVLGSNKLVNQNTHAQYCVSSIKESHAPYPYLF